MIIKPPVKSFSGTDFQNGLNHYIYNRRRRFPSPVGLRTVSFWVDFCRELAVKRNFSARPPAGCLAVFDYRRLARPPGTLAVMPTIIELWGIFEIV
jgi:hypothetical protein